jgi:hypothetical protein
MSERARMRGRKTGGRRAGTPNNATAFRRELASEGYRNALSAGVTPLEVVFRVMRGGPEAADISERQYDAAKAALPYTSARLTASFVSASYNPDGRLSHEERLRLLERGPQLEGEVEPVPVRGSEEG